jgi:hypothetical protein
VGPATLRELPASLVAMWDVWIAKPLPVLGDPEPIFTTSEDAAQGAIGLASNITK